VAHPQIAAFARLAKGGDAPDRVIFGQKTKLSRTMHDIRYNEKRDEIYVTNPFAQAILTFRGDADLQAAPVRIIQGPKTMLGAQDTLEVDSVNDEILIPSESEILVFSAGANGDVAPIRRPHRATPNPGWNIGSGIAVDPVHNVIATDGSVSGELAKKYPSGAQQGGRGGGAGFAGGRNSILIWDRLAYGEAMPLRVIRGDKTGIRAIRQMQIYPQGGWVVISQITDGSVPEPDGTFVGVWSIYDNGNVPPMWKIPGSGGAMVMKKPRGVALDPKHKEVIVSDMRLNAVLTFSLPEMFDQVAKPNP
jgi:hypothetical protein